MTYNQKFNDDGFLLLKNLLSNQEKSLFKKTFYEIVSKYINIKKNSFVKGFDNPLLHKKLLFLRNNNPERFSDLYLELGHNASVRSIFYSKRFIKVFAKILKIKPEMIYINGFMFRLDAPFDKRNTLPWHMDGPYYEQTSPLYNAGVCWLPLTDNKPENGTVKYILESKKKINGNKLKWVRKNRLSSGIIEVPINSEQEKKSKDLYANFGDVAFFNMHLKHRSGKNTSKKFRLTIECRFHDISKKFNIGKEIYIYKKTNKPFLNKNFKYSKTY